MIRDVVSEQRIAGCLNSHYKSLSKDAFSDSEWLFGDDITKKSDDYKS